MKIKFHNKGTKAKKNAYETNFVSISVEIVCKLSMTIGDNRNTC